MRCLTTLSCTCLAVAALLATTETPSFAEAVCAPTAGATGKTVSLTAGSYHSIHFHPTQPIAYAVGTQTIISFDYLATNPSATKISGSDTLKTWLGNQATGANAQFESTGGIPDAAFTKIYVSKAADSAAKEGVFTLDLTGNKPVDLISGKVDRCDCCAAGDGLAAMYKQIAAPVWADASESALLIPVFGCNHVAKLVVSSPFTMSFVVGTGNALNSVNAVGISAHVQQPIALAPWRDRFYLLCYTGRIVEILPYNNYQVKDIRGSGTGTITAASQVWDNTFSVASPFWGAGQIATWGNCWLQFWSKSTTHGHIVDPDGDNTLYKIQGIAATADFSIADPTGSTLWVAGQGGTGSTLVKYTMTYPNCPAAKGQNYCKWASITKTLPPIPPTVTRSLDAPTPVPPPPTPQPTATDAGSTSAAASTAGVTTSAAATSATTTSAVAATNMAAASTTVAATTSTATTSAATAAATTSAATTAAAAALTTGGTSGNSGAASVLSPFNLGPCHYSKTAWSLTEGVRHRSTVDFSTNTDYTTCTFVFSCPSTSSGMAFKMTKSVPTSGYLSVTVNTSNFDTLLSYTALTSVNTDIDSVLGAKTPLQISAWGNGGSFALAATCIPASSPQQVPANSHEVNYLSRDYYSTSHSYYSTASQLYTYKPGFKQFTPVAARRRSYGLNENRAFLISCNTADMTTNNYVVQLDTISGSTGSSADVLTILATDSLIATQFSGSAISTTYSTRQTNTSKFEASSQYYLTWTSDGTSDSSSETGVSVTYFCGDSVWTTSGVVVEQGTTSGATHMWVTPFLVAVTVLVLGIVNL